MRLPGAIGAKHRGAAHECPPRRQPSRPCRAQPAAVCNALTWAAVCRGIPTPLRLIQAAQTPGIGITAIKCPLLMCDHQETQPDSVAHLTQGGLTFEHLRHLLQNFFKHALRQDCTQGPWLLTPGRTLQLLVREFDPLQGHGIRKAQRHRHGHGSTQAAELSLRRFEAATCAGRPTATQSVERSKNANLKGMQVHDAAQAVREGNLTTLQAANFGT